MSEYIGIHDVRQMTRLRMERRGKIAERGTCGCLRVLLSGRYQWQFARSKSNLQGGAAERGGERVPNQAGCVCKR